MRPRHAPAARRVDEGTGVIGYFGHGSLTLWAQEKVLGVDDVGKLANHDRLPVVFTVTCLSGFFDHPSTPSLGETLLRAAKGGAVAALVPSSAGVLADQGLLAQSLASALSEARLHLGTADDARRSGVAQPGRAARHRRCTRSTAHLQSPGRPGAALAAVGPAAYKFAFCHGDMPAEGVQPRGALSQQVRLPGAGPSAYIPGLLRIRGPQHDGDGRQ